MGIKKRKFIIMLNKNNNLKKRCSVPQENWDVDRKCYKSNYNNNLQLGTAVDRIKSRRERERSIMKETEMALYNKFREERTKKKKEKTVLRTGKKENKRNKKFCVGLGIGRR